MTFITSTWWHDGSRRLPLFVAIVLPLFGWLRLFGQRAGLYDTEFGLAIVTMSSRIILAIMIWRTALTLNKKDIERKHAELLLKRYANQRLSLSEIGQNALKGIDISILMDAVVNIVVESLDVEYRKILELLPDGKSMLLKAGVGWKDGLVGYARLVLEWIYRLVTPCFPKNLSLVEDLRTETRFRGTPLLYEHGIISGIRTDIVEIDDTFIKKHGFGKVGMYALLSFSDSGTGMDEKTRAMIFEPFFTTKEVGKGTGLGLAIVYGIVTQHNGYIDVETELGKGTIFRVYLPVIKHETVKVKADTFVAPIGGTETILVAEDEEFVRSVMKMMLEKHGYKVIEATDGENAIRKFKENKDKIQLLLFDVIMPHMNGKEAYNEIKKIKSGIKALFLSGYSEEIIHKQELIEAGIKLISKPISPTELLRVVRETLDK